MPLRTQCMSLKTLMYTFEDTVCHLGHCMSLTTLSVSLRTLCIILRTVVNVIEDTDVYH